MQLKVIGSSSLGNCYALESSTGEILLLECGVRFDLIKKALNHRLSNITGVLITHSHQDHCKAFEDVLKAGIYAYATPGTIDELGFPHHRAKQIIPGVEKVVGSYKVIAFDTKHDTKQPCGFLIWHSEMGTCLFLTDSYYVEYIFPGLNNVIIECNYAQDIIDHKVESGSGMKFLRDRIIESHMSLETCKMTLQANDLSLVNNIVLVHLSNSNSDARRFKCEVEEQTGKHVHIADAGMSINFNKDPF